MTTKGIYHDPFLLGERDPDFIRRRLLERQPRWDRVNALWLRNYPLAAKFYRAILACRPLRMTVTGLVEDGLFEETIQPSVALFAETIWNPRRSDREILQRAMSPYYRRG